MTAPTVVDTDALPPTQYLIIEVLAARHRLGKTSWTFPARLRPHLAVLTDTGLVGCQSGSRPGTVIAWLTDAGRAAALPDSYTPPRDSERVRVVVVVKQNGRVHGITCDNAEAQQWVRDLVAQADDPLAATMTVGLVTPRAGA